MRSAAVPGMLQGVVCVLLLVVAGIEPGTAYALQSQELKEAVDAILAGNSSGSGGGPGVVVLPSALSVDLVGLLKLALQTLPEQSESKTPFRGYRQSSAQHPIQVDNLDIVKLGGKNYFFSKKQKFSWINAVSYCRLIGMELVSVESREEDLLIIEHLNSLGLGGKMVVYTGGNKVGRSTYLWLNGAPLIYENWLPGEPADPATEHCLVYYEQRWHDYHCTGFENPFICEEPL